MYDSVLQVGKRIRELLDDGNQTVIDEIVIGTNQKPFPHEQVFEKV